MSILTESGIFIRSYDSSLECIAQDLMFYTNDLQDPNMKKHDPIIEVQSSDYSTAVCTLKGNIYLIGPTPSPNINSMVTNDILNNNGNRCYIQNGAKVLIKNPEPSSLNYEGYSTFYHGIPVICKYEGSVLKSVFYSKYKEFVYKSHTNIME
ncbi:MAG: hypothetical protein MHPSP_001960, partial [Paramarteilia canceri]